MKEKIWIFLLCAVLLSMNLLNTADAVGGVRKIRSKTGESVKTTEEYFKIIKSGNSYTLQACDKGDVSEEAFGQDMKLYALAACMIDADSGRVLFSKNADEVRAMASTTKILTCLLALEQYSLDDIVTVSEYAASMPDVQLNMQAGDKFRMYDLLLSLMLESHNDTAVAIAEHVGGTVEQFCRMMTERARQIGCTSSVFLTPNGLDKEIVTEQGKQKHATTAKELAMILRECLKNEQFVAICRSRQAMISNVANTRSYQLSNHNVLLDTMEGAIAGKTGFTCDAGYCYVGAVQRNGVNYVCALLGCGWPNNKNYKWHDMKVMIDSAQSEFCKMELPNEITNADIFTDIPLYNMKANGVQVSRLDLNRNNYENCTVTVREGEILTVQYTLPEYFSKETKAGDEVGMICYKISGQTIKNEGLTASQTIEPMMFTDYLNVIYDSYLLAD